MCQLDVCSAVARLTSLHDGDAALPDIIAIGDRAILPLQRLLFSREPSGLFHARCRAVEALAALGAHAVLLEFLGSGYTASDPVEQTGEEAVVNACARALIGVQSATACSVLVSLAKRRPLAGVIEALGSWHDAESIPFLVDALLEDSCRPAAERAIRSFGSTACADLAAIAMAAAPDSDSESESSLRRRRSALGLLAELGGRTLSEQALSCLIHERDPGLSLLACRLCMDHAKKALKQQAFHRLFELLPASWLQAQEIEDCLIPQYLESALDIERAAEAFACGSDSARRQAATILARVRSKAAGTSDDAGEPT